MATDGPGYRSILETVAESKRKNLGVCAGFCWRYHPGMRETFQRMKDGAIGKVMAILSMLWHPARTMLSPLST